ncbi:hypothetical protein ACFC1R_37525 [Kitasatospora sp. NPDC056138]|uniref:hypothetical protein n=1 Tax=Kitasatospora sp. NPDC056138 TaxID=3345724 RepID=UPI0035E0D63C
MESIVAGQRAANVDEFAELALGVDVELFTGPTGPESLADRAARLDAAHDILAVLRRETPELATYAARLLKSAPAVLPAARRVVGAGRGTVGLGVAA